MIPRLSVIVASYRRCDELQGCLQDLAAQAEKSFEVVLVLQDYPEGSADRLRTEFGQSLTLRIAEFPHGLGTGGARNEGLRIAGGDIVSFLDDDVRLPSDWTASVLACYDDPSVGGAGGFVNHPGHYGPLRNTAYRLLGLTSDRFRIDWGGFNLGPSSNRPGVHTAEWLLGGNMSFRREVMLAVGGFDEKLGTFWHEDADVSHRVLKAGWRVVSSEKVVVDHLPSSVNRPSLRAQVLERERTRVRFVWKAIGDGPLWQLRYCARLFLHAGAMAVVGLAKRDAMIPVNVLRGGWRGLRELRQSQAQQAAAAAATPVGSAR